MKTSALNLSVIVSLLVCSLAHGYTLRKGQDGKVLIWDADRVEIYIDKSSLPKVGGAVDAVRAGFDVWSSSGMPIEFEYEISEKPLSRDGRDGKTVVVFENNKWGHGEDVVAITLTTYRKSNGYVMDSDIVLNAVDHEWTTSPREEPRKFDVQNVVAHEVGHFVGLGHSDGHGDATMYPTTPTGESKKRSLADDDLNGLAALVEEVNDRRGTGARTVQSGDEDSPVGGVERQQPMGCVVGSSSMVDGWLMLLVVAGLWVARRGRRSAAALVLLVALCGGSAAQATVVRALGLDQLLAKANVVVEGRVVARRALWVNGMIVTEATVEVEACHKGQCQRQRTLRVPGGQIGDVAMVVEGVRCPQMGERVMLFARQRTQHQVIEAVGLSQGLLKLRQNVAVRDLSGLQLVAPGNTLRPVNVPTQFDLGKLRTMIRTLLGASTATR